MEKMQRVTIGQAKCTNESQDIIVRVGRLEFSSIKFLAAAGVELDGVEMKHAAPLLIHGLCLSRLINRVIHSYAVSQEKENVRLRVAGVVLTFLAIAVAALRLLVSFLAKL
jgi:uncharacterized protein